MSTERLIIVDGYNLILRSPQLRPDAGRTLRDSRDKLINLLAWAVGTGDAQFLVIFDGAEAGGQNERNGRVEVRFSRPPEKADDQIRRIVEDRVDKVERVTVVTADLEVARHARAMGADVALSDLFLASILGPVTPPTEASEKPTILSKKELEEWAEIFRHRRPSDASREDETEH